MGCVLPGCELATAARTLQSVIAGGTCVSAPIAALDTHTSMHVKGSY